MLHKIVNLIKSSTYKIESTTLFCRDCIIQDVECLNYLEANNVLESPLHTTSFGSTIDLELSLVYLNSLGFYENARSFILKNKYKEPSAEYYLLDLDSYKDNSCIFLDKYRSILILINAIESFGKHTYIDLDTKNSIIFSEEKSLFLSFKYTQTTLDFIPPAILGKIAQTSLIFNGDNSEKKLLFINELMELLHPQMEDERFVFLLTNFNTFYEKSLAAYQFYLRDFSYNKLKLEIDTKALDYTQRIQGVINDSQSKLIAIPTAFVLVFTVFDFENIVEIKNVVAIISLFIFAIIIQLFLNNQLSVLKFIKENIESYKESFKENDIEKISRKFVLVGQELKRQKRRLRLVQFILWLIPFSLLIIWFYLQPSFICQ
jgi:hypothetical protein